MQKMKMKFLRRRALRIQNKCNFMDNNASCWDRKHNFLSNKEKAVAQQRGTITLSVIFSSLYDFYKSYL
jgi:hypothetical protein